MKASRVVAPGLGERYERALRAYLARGGEAELHAGYELGREALAEGTGLLELVALHQQAASAALDVAAPSVALARQAQASGRFLLEALSPFELLIVGNRDTNAALRRLNQILEEEAKRIAHALHDEAGQLLATAYLELAEIKREIDAPAQARVDRIVGHLDRVREQLRLLSHELRPPILDQFGLLPALRFLAGGVRKRTGLVIEVGGRLTGRCPRAVETTLYRAVQEALTNVCRHAKACKAWVHVAVEGRSIVCRIGDDGVGFDANAPGHEMRRGLGLLGIEERVSALKGTLAIRSTPGRGTELRIALPAAPGG